MHRQVQQLELLFLLLTLLHPVQAALQRPIPTETGQLSGGTTKDNAISFFKGIPYAAPPTGPKRWRRPEPPTAWTGIRAATQFGPNCAQRIEPDTPLWTHEFRAHGPVSEDCLTLNIWTPAVAHNEKRPVLVFLHGGSNTTGSGAIDVLNGEGMARKGLVMVTLNYRLGIFGFFTHPDLSSESANHVSGNYGLLDQIAALQWLHRNIAAFGGDPDRITLAGQSAGAFDVSYLLISPLAKGLFQRAILESGGALPVRDMRTLNESEAAGLQFAATKSVEQLRTLSAADLLTATASFGAIADDYVIPATPIAKTDVPLLTGTNANEHLPSPLPWATASSQAYLYHFNHPLPGPNSAKFGAFHCAEMPYVLNNLSQSPRPFTPIDRRVAQTLSSYWANFAANGNPNGPGLPHWPQATLMQLGTNNHPTPTQTKSRHH
jgi:para-nitrobenzyl esterase